MAIYDFKCNECDFVFEEICVYDDVKDILKECPSCFSKAAKIQMPSPNLVSGINHRSKVPSDFREGILEPMKKHYKRINPNINDTIRT